LFNCAVSKYTGGDSTEAEKNVSVGICVFVFAVLYAAIMVSIHPMRSRLCLLAGTQYFPVTISPSFCPGKFVPGICDDFYAGGKIKHLYQGENF
jgi:hypothetical protein